MNPTNSNSASGESDPNFAAPAKESKAPPSRVPQNIYPNDSPLHSRSPSDLPPAPPKRHHDNWHSVLSTILLFLLAPLLALFIAAFVIQSYQVDGESMETTLQNHDRLIVDKLPRTWARITNHNYVPKRGDIIIFNQAGLADTSNFEQKQLIKRVVGLPGEHIIVKDGQITIHNRSHPQGFNPDSSSGYHITAKDTPGAVDLVIPQGQIFVCGDNRTNSEDSRYFGPVNVDNIVGKLSLRLLPLSKFQKF
jgi:signal peptidase I